MIRRIVIINGNPAPDKYRLSTFLAELEERLIASGLSVIHHSLSEKEIKTCIGCWDCWWKTPGICRHKDDEPQLLKDIINSDLVIYASPVIIGMYSGLLKLFQDRTIPLIHPYIEIKNGLSHHKKRYPKYPETAVILERGDATKGEIECIREIFNHVASNYHSDLKIFQTIEQSNPKEICNAISNI